MYGLGFVSEMQRNALYQQLALLALGNVTFKKAAGGGSSEKYDCADKKQLHLSRGCWRWSPRSSRRTLRRERWSSAARAS